MPNGFSTTGHLPFLVWGGVTSRCVPHQYLSPHTPAMLCASHTSFNSRRDCTPTSFFRVMKRRSIGFRVKAKLQNRRRSTIHCNTRNTGCIYTLCYTDGGQISMGDKSRRDSGVRATTGELRPRNRPRVYKTSVFVDFWDFCLRIPGVARIVRPHPDY